MPSMVGMGNKTTLSYFKDRVEEKECAICRSTGQIIEHTILCDWTRITCMGGSFKGQEMKERVTFFSVLETVVCWVAHFLLFAQLNN